MDLTNLSRADLQKMRRHADDMMKKFPGTKDSARAEERLILIDEEQARRSIPGNIETFLLKFPMGFKDPAYEQTELNDKDKASRACRVELSPQAFKAAMESGDPALLIDVVKQIVSRTNLIQGSFEKPKLFDAIRDERNSAPFLAALEDLMHGPGEAPDRLERFSTYMQTLGLRKWTYGTYFLFLSDPQNCMFVKPEGLKEALEATAYPLTYHSTPTAALYRQIMEFARWVEAKLLDTKDERLLPKSMIDVQSFIWHMAPTGKWAK